MDYRGKVQAAGLIVALLWIGHVQPVASISCDREVARTFTRYCSHLRKRSVEPNGFLGRLRGISGSQLLPMRTLVSDEDVLEYEEEPKLEASPAAEQREENQLVQLIDEYLQQDVIARSGLYRRRSRNISPRSRPPRKYNNVLPSALHNCDLAALKEICRNR
ncbi:uncharacterized protein LOC129586337 [Paramacrobiotus metropolitanus]|uniref:uncharacterized protein LOC129586337 n=1 Tax=Paramacrobiotus metropolitanus TaxID=2943436 RepID=UPI0024457076|nr:uncharacterized protein LOC129586337 [Paramacrobiotus metropolitanus]